MRLGGPRAERASRLQQAVSPANGRYPFSDQSLIPPCLWLDLYDTIQEYEVLTSRPTQAAALFVVLSVRRGICRVSPSLRSGFYPTYEEPQQLSGWTASRALTQEYRGGSIVGRVEA